MQNGTPPLAWSPYFSKHYTVTALNVLIDIAKGTKNDKVMQFASTKQGLITFLQHNANVGAIQSLRHVVPVTLLPVPLPIAQPQTVLDSSTAQTGVFVKPQLSAEEAAKIRREKHRLYQKQRRKRIRDQKLLLELQLRQADNIKAEEARLSEAKSKQQYLRKSVAPTTKRPATTSIESVNAKRKKKCIFDGNCQRLSRGSTGLCIAHGGGRRCQFQGCKSGAEGSGNSVFCKRHGGGRRCGVESCHKSARGGTRYCISHGGGRRCSYSGCGKAAVGSTPFCIAHGGGRRCQFAGGCAKAAQGSTKLCKAHGGGRRCQRDFCTRSAEGATKYCVGHGGGRRCEVTGCSKSAQGRTKRCKGHGGGRRCQVLNCTKSAQGATDFCKAHGGGKRCQFAGCAKSARGKTDYCISHGGGKRCQELECSKSAVGASNFCISHGGGRRCGIPLCTRSARGGSEYCRAHGTIQKKKQALLRAVSATKVQVM